MPHQPTSKVLFVSICSLNKAEGGGRSYARSETVASLLSAPIAKRLRQRRERARQLVVGLDSPNRQGVEVSELFYNDHLARGEDFGGKEGTPLYLPAVERYKGRFFLSMGKDRSAVIREANHHVLFLSGLYGIVRALEPIQLYSCPLDGRVAQMWREDELLTTIVNEYIDRHGIKRVIDLTAIEAYRNLIDWRKMGRAADVLHCFWSGGAGADALIPFGETLRRMLEMSDDELLQLSSDQRMGQIIYRTAPRRGDDFPEEPIEEPYEVGSVEQVLGGGIANPASADGEGTWRFSATRKFQRDVRNHKGLFVKATNAIVTICQDPLNPQGDTIKSLSGSLKGLWRYKLGDFRLIYRPDTEDRVIHCQRLVKKDSQTYENLT